MHKHAEDMHFIGPVSALLMIVFSDDFNTQRWICLKQPNTSITKDNLATLFIPQLQCSEMNLLAALVPGLPKLIEERVEIWVLFQECVDLRIQIVSGHMLRLTGHGWHIRGSFPFGQEVLIIFQHVFPYLFATSILSPLQVKTTSVVPATPNLIFQAVPSSKNMPIDFRHMWRLWRAWHIVGVYVCLNRFLNFL